MTTYLTSINNQAEAIEKTLIDLGYQLLDRGKYWQCNAVYRDGGLLDYHPVPDNVLSPTSGLVLYPHFYPYLIEGWFDKFFPWRKVALSRLDNVVLVSPSSEFVCSLPQSRIPDRQDFYRYKGQDARRQQIWREVMERSEELGAEWLSLTKSGKIADVVEMLD